MISYYDRLPNLFTLMFIQFCIREVLYRAKLSYQNKLKMKLRVEKVTEETI